FGSGCRCRGARKDSAMRILRPRTRCVLRALAALAALIAAGPGARPAAAQSQYPVTDLGVLGGALGLNNSVARGVNDSGVVAGWSYNNNRTQQSGAFRWSAAAGMQSLPDVGGVIFSGGN